MDPAARLHADVAALAGGIGPRHPAHPGSLDRAAAHIAQRLADAGLAVRREAFAAQGHDWCNLVAEIPGAAPIVLVAAHYDTVAGSPGADDNASGIAVLLEMARRAAADPIPCTLRLLATANEEGMRLDRAAGGSAHHVRTAAAGIRAALVLDCLGCCDIPAGGQAWPAWWMPWIHGRRGDFLCLQALWRDRVLARACAAAARAAAPLPVRGCWWPGQTWQMMGDQEVFAAAGIPTLALTDTDRLRNPRYHRPGDRPETVDPRTLAAAADAAWVLLRCMAGKAARDFR